MRIRKGDKVKVIAGKDAARGAEGPVMRVLPQSQRVVVEKVAVAKKAQRPTRDNPSGGIMSIERPIHVSNVMLICPKCNKPTRVGMKVEEHKKVRVCKKCGKDID
ncbi:MAG: 50S ribosomal protein L24 [Coriobacteriales bacterium]|nr:50S ribosomal protein L24 [Coriobacteriales bacterium]